MSSNIVLIGMPGVGKSLFGSKLAQKLGREFLDIDDMIEDEVDLKLQQIINRFGDDEFISIEEKRVLELSEVENCVIAPGGSVIYSVKAMDFFRKNSTIVFLNASFESIRERITNQDTRGIVGLAGKDLRTLFNERLPLYREWADITVEVPPDSDADAVVELIIRAVGGKHE